MPSKKPLVVFITSFSIILGSVAFTTPLLAASSEKILYSFCPGSTCVGGAEPAAGVIFDKVGNLHGTAAGGGAYQNGAVFELTPKHGQWTEKVLHAFNSSDGSAGGWPYFRPG